MSTLGDAVPIGSDGVAGYAGRLFDYLVNHPEVVRLLGHEGLRYANDVSEIPDFDERVAYNQRRISSIRESVAPSADAQSLFMAISSMAYWFVSTPQIVRMVYGPDSVAAREQYRAVVVRAVEVLVAG